MEIGVLGIGLAVLITAAIITAYKLGKAVREAEIEQARSAGYEECANDRLLTEELWTH